MNIFTTLIASVFCGYVFSAILLAIVDTYMEKCFNTKDNADYDKYFRQIQIIYTVIFSILAYIILPRF